MRWQQKPFLGTLIDPTHTMAKGIIGAWTLNEGTGMRLVNAASPGIYDMGPYVTGGGWVLGPNGLGYLTNSSFFVAGVIPDINGLTGLTLFMKGNWSNSFSSGRSGDGPGLLNLFADSSGLITATVGSSNYGTVNTGILGECSLAMVFDGTATGNSGRLKVYVNGTPATLTFTGTIPSTIPTSATSWYLAAQRFRSPDYTSRRDLDLLWGRALTATEIGAVTANPWDLWRPAPGWTEAEAQAYYTVVGRPIIRGGSPNLCIGPSLVESPMIGGYW